MQLLPRVVNGQRETRLRLESVLVRTVYRGLLALGPEESVPVAVKAGQDLEKELQVLRLVGSHPNVVPLLEVTTEGRETFLVTELCEGSVADLAPLQAEHEVNALVGQLLQVVSFLHTNIKVYF